VNAEYSPSLDHVRFQDAQATLFGDQNGVRVWRSPDSDGIGLLIVQTAPDLPRDAATDEAFIAAYRTLFVNPKAPLIEVGLDRIGTQRVVRSIVAVPQPSGGAMFIGSLTIPFADFGYVLKVQCEEHGLKGVREKAILDRQVAAGLAQHGENGITGEFEPYLASYDAEFPNHPLTRARHWLQRLVKHTLLDKSLKRVDPFGLPDGPG
jgi:hypothetical protein